MIEAQVRAQSLVGRTTEIPSLRLAKSPKLIDTADYKNISLLAK